MKENHYRLCYECQMFRMSIGKTQKDVAHDVGCTAQNVSAFETGKINSLSIFVWYILQGMDIERIRAAYGKRV